MDAVTDFVHRRWLLILLIFKGILSLALINVALTTELYPLQHLDRLNKVKSGAFLMMYVHVHDMCVYTIILSLLHLLNNCTFSTLTSTYG